MFIGNKKDVELEELYNKITVLERKANAIYYEKGNSIKYKYYKWKLKRLKRKEDRYYANKKK